MGIIDDGTGTGRSDGGTGMSRSLGLGVETGGCPVPVESEVSRGSTGSARVSHSPVNDYVVWSPDVIASIPPRQSSIVCCVTDPGLPLDLSQQPRESPRVLVGSAARWQEDSKIRKDRSGDIPTKPTQAWPKIMSSVMDIQHDNLPLTQDYRPLQNDPAFFFLGAPSHYVPAFQARQLPHSGKGPEFPKLFGCATCSPWSSGHQARGEGHPPRSNDLFLCGYLGRRRFTTLHILFAMPPGSGVENWSGHAECCEGLKIEDFTQDSLCLLCSFISCSVYC